MNINSHTELYCIFGKPVKHSLSPVMHNNAFREMNINAVFLAFSPLSIKDAIESMKILNIKGASITIPFKINAMKFVDEIDELAGNIGSINTLKNNDGKITGYNTDGYGALRALVKNHVEVENSSILIIGNGGSARAVAFTLLDNGASVVITGRNINNIIKLHDDIKTRYEKIDTIVLNNLNEQFMDDFDIIINTTPVGMEPDIDSMPLNENLINSRHIVFDIVYSPDMTMLLRAAEKKGCRIIRGIDMLVYQGITQFKIWTDKDVSADVIYKSVYRVIKK